MSSINNRDFNLLFKSPCNCKNKFDIVLHKYESDYFVNQVT